MVMVNYYKAMKMGLAKACRLLWAQDVEADRHQLGLQNFRAESL